MSGKVVVRTVAPEATSWVCRSSSSARALPKYGPGRVTSFIPMHTEIRSGCNASAAGSCSSSSVFDPPAADGQVGVRHAGVVGVDHRGEAVGEAGETDGVVAVPQPFCLAIADRDISGVPRHTGTLAAKRRFDLRCSGVRRKFTVARGHHGAAGAQDIDHLDDRGRRGTR